MSKFKSYYIFYICIIVSLGGLLFGLDQGLMNGALQLIGRDLSLNIDQKAFFAALLLWGAVLGSICSGYISHLLSRKYTLVMTAIIFGSCSFLSTITLNINLLSFYRFMLGIVVGISSLTVPLYLAEISPTKWRGAFISCYQLTITIGIFAAFSSNHLIIKYFNAWQPMFYIITIPATLMFLGLLFVPKTPRWLILCGYRKKAYNILKNIRISPQEIKQELKEMDLVLKKEKKTNILQLFKNCFVLKALLLGIIIQIAQQTTGINCIIYYSTSIFHVAGIHNATIATIIVGVVNMLTTILSVLFIDKLGRKPILYFGYIVMTITLLFIAFFMYLEVIGIHISNILKFVLVADILLFIFAFAISAGPIAWVLCAELFPLKVRDYCLTITTTTNWIFAALIVNFSLPLIKTLHGTPNPKGGAIVFLIFAICCLVFLLVLKYFIPETNGVSLEELEINLINGVKLRDLGKKINK